MADLPVPKKTKSTLQATASKTVEVVRSSVKATGDRIHVAADSIQENVVGALVVDTDSLPLKGYKRHTTRSSAVFAHMEYNRADIRDRTKTAKLRTYIRQMLEDPFGTRRAYVLSIFLIVMILLSVVVLAVSTVDGYEDETTQVYELVFNIIFTAELVVRLCVMYDKVSEVFRDGFFYVDALSIAPFYIEILSGEQTVELIKAFRIFRLFKLTRDFSGAKTIVVAANESFSALLLPMFFLFVVSVSLGVMGFYLEKGGTILEGSDSAFSSAPHSIWFIVVTMTTVGYGDVYPATVLAKCTNIFAMVFGILFLAMPLSIIGSNFCSAWLDRDRTMFIEAMRKKLAEKGMSKSNIMMKFKEFDIDGNGFINFKEFVVASRELGIDMSSKILHKLWKSIDHDEDVADERDSNVLTENANIATISQRMILHSEHKHVFTEELGEKLDKLGQLDMLDTEQVKSVDKKMQQRAATLESMNATLDALALLLAEAPS